MYMIHNLTQTQLVYLKDCVPGVARPVVTWHFPNAHRDASLVIDYQNGTRTLTQIDPYRARYRTIMFSDGNITGAYGNTIVGSIARARKNVKEAR